MRKTLAIAIAAFVLSAGAVAHAAGYISLASAARVNFASGGQVNTSAATGTIYGFSTHPTSDAVLTDKMLKSVGASWQRTDLSWGSVQATSSGSFVWGGYDTRTNQAIADGISTVYIINGTPAWAATSSCASNCAPVNAATIATFCTAVAQHYDNKVMYYEFYNEANGNGVWGPAALASDYALDLNACYAAMHAVDSNIKLGVGGLNSTFGAWGGINWQTFTNAIINANYDFFGAHPYTYSLDVNDSFWGWCGTGNGIICGTRAALNAAGKSAIQIMITEYGAPTCGPSGVSLQNQADEARAMIATSTGASASYMNLFPAKFWYTLIDADSNDCSTSENSFGIFTSDGRPKPVFEVLRNK